MDQRKRKWFFITLASVILCLAVMVFAFLSIRHLPKYSYSIDDWKSEHAVYRDSGFSVDDKIKDSGKPTEFLWGPYLPLKKGSYTANIHYAASDDQFCLATASGGAAELFISSDGILSRYLNNVSYQFETADDVPEFQLVIRYSGSGDFTVNSISISPNSNQPKRIAVEIIAIVLLADCVILFFEQNLEKKNTILALAGITALISMPLAVYGHMDGHDLDVHLLRIEAIVQALRSGQFPARISSLTLYGLGYPFSIYYNDLFLYFPAVLRVLGFSVTQAYKIYVFSVNLLTVIISFCSFSRIMRENKTALIMTLLYAAASYRLVNIYARGSVGEYTAQAFLPLLALAFYNMYFKEGKGSKHIIRNSLILTAAVSGIIGAHILTTIIAGFMMLVICLVFWKKTFRASTLLTFVSAGILILLVNLYFLVPFVDYYINVPTFIRNVVDNTIRPIQKSGVFPGQLFAFFQQVNGLVDKVNERMQLTPGLPLVLLFFAGIYRRFFVNRGRIYDFLLIFCFLSLWISSDLFPWDWLLMHFSSWNYLATIQFPFRFLVAAILFLTLFAGLFLKLETMPYLREITVTAAVLMCIWAVCSLFNSNSTRFIYDTSSMYADMTKSEYLIAGTSWGNFDPEPKGENMAEIRILSRSSNVLNLYCKADDSPEMHLVDAPLYNYKGYHVYDEDGREYQIINGEENRICFVLPDDFEGKTAVVFQDPTYWTAALCVSALTVFGILIVIIVYIRKNCKTRTAA